MNCRRFQQLLSRERDESLPAAERAALDGHLAGCPECRRLQADLAAAAESWRSEDRRIQTPDAKAEWLALSARLDQPARSPAPRRRAPDHKWIAIWSTGAALAALAVPFIAGLLRSPADSPPEPVALASADYVETGDPTATPVVYVDEASGWLIVWAEGSATPATSG